MPMPKWLAWPKPARNGPPNGSAAAVPDALRRVAGLNLPVYLTTDLRPVATPRVGTVPHKVFVTSVPKAGTYLVSELLGRLGCVATQLHLWKTGLSDYRQAASIKEMRDNYTQFEVAIPLSASLSLVSRGQFAVGHIECDTETCPLLREFKTLFAYRELRDAFVSWMRFHLDAKRGGEQIQAIHRLPDGPERTLAMLDLRGDLFFPVVRTLVPWLRRPDVFPVRFETLYGDEGGNAQRQLITDLVRFLEAPVPASAIDDVLANLIGTPTLTWSGHRSSRQRYWDERVEERFRACRGHELNLSLGYAG